jgi:hypothetical protein
MEQEYDVDEPVKKGDFCFTSLAGKKMIRYFVVEILDIDETNQLFTVKYLKKVGLNKNSFIYDKDDVFEITNDDIIFKLPKPMSTVIRGRVHLTFGVNFAGYTVE